MPLRAVYTPAMTDPLPIVAFARELPGSPDLPACRLHPGGGRLQGAELHAHVAGASAVVTWVSERVDAAFLDACGPQLKLVANFAVGTDNIDLDACRARGVVVTNTPDAVTEGTADMAWALILATARRLVQADAFARTDAYAETGPVGPAEWLGADLTGRTLLIVGAGRIGRAVALRSIGWGMRVLYVARSMHWDFEQAPLAAERVTLDEGLKRADVVSLHTPLTDETRGLIGARELGLMKPSAMLINTARGPVVDEAALAAALEAGRLWGAGLDVFEKEPEVHPGIRASDRVTLAPHIGSAETRYREQMTAMVCASIRSVLAGEEPANRVV